RAPADRKYSHRRPTHASASSSSVNSKTRSEPPSPLPLPTNSAAFSKKSSKRSSSSSRPAPASPSGKWISMLTLIGSPPGRLPTSGRRPQQFGQQFLQGGRVHRLDQVAVEPRFLRPALVLVLAPAGQGDEDHVLAPRLFADAPADVESVQP